MDLVNCKPLASLVQVTGSERHTFELPAPDETLLGHIHAKTIMGCFFGAGRRKKNPRGCSVFAAIFYPLPLIPRELVFKLFGTLDHEVGVKERSETLSTNP
jgi:hypothetical protein